MFDLVADVERYPEFLPLCESLVVRSRRKDGDKEILIATMTVAYKFIREFFTTRVVARPADISHPRRLYRRAVQLPRERLALRAAGARRVCIVHFTIDYEFRSRTLSLLMGAVFDRAFRKFAEAFEARADAVYSRVS